MNVMNIVYSMLSIGGLGVVFGAGLGFASKVFHVDEDPRVGQVMECLPGANCGGCGYPGCAGCATAIVEGKAPVNACPVGGAAAAAKIGAVMGVTVTESEPTAAFVGCAGTCDKAKYNYTYEGIEDCNMAVQLAGSSAKACAYGCLGLGSCIKVCKFGALKIENGVAVVDKEKCTSCGACTKACPKGLIKILPANKKVKLQCSSKDKGKDVMQACTAGCIGCGICAKTCPFGAIEMVNNLPVIDYAKCKNCGLCANKCPKKILTGYKVEAPKPAAPAKPAEAPAAAPAKEEKEEAKA